jgi:hypothetical protein
MVWFSSKRSLERWGSRVAGAWFAALLATGCQSAPRRWTYRFDPEKTATLRGGKAVAPAGNLPGEVQRALEAANRIVGKPYKYGGGHRQVEDSGYDCSGSVSYALRAAGVLEQPIDSRGFREFGSRGPGRYITVFAGRGHVFAEIAGLRLDTGFGPDSNQGPQWSTLSRPAAGYEMRHPPGL